MFVSKTRQQDNKTHKTQDTTQDTRKTHTQDTHKTYTQDTHTQDTRKTRKTHHTTPHTQTTLTTTTTTTNTHNTEHTSPSSLNSQDRMDLQMVCVRCRGPQGFPKRMQKHEVVESLSNVGHRFKSRKIVSFHDDVGSSCCRDFVSQVFFERRPPSLILDVVSA